MALNKYTTSRRFLTTTTTFPRDYSESDLPSHGDFQGPNTRLLFDRSTGTGTMYHYGSKNEIIKKNPVTRKNIRSMMDLVDQDKKAYGIK